MIYLTAGGGNFRIIVLDSRDIENLKSPHPWFSPDRTALVAFTPDPDWLLSRIRMGPGTPGDIAKSIDEAASRPQAEFAAPPLVGANGQPIKLVPAEADEPKPPRPGEAEPYLRAALRDLWEWQRTVQELPPLDLSDRIRQLLGEGA